MAYPMGESKEGCLRVDFDRRLKLEFHGSDISSDAGPLPYRELDDALARGRGTLVTDYFAGKAHQDRRQGRASWSPHPLPDGGGRHLKTSVRRIPAPD